MLLLPRTPVSSCLSPISTVPQAAVFNIAFLHPVHLFFLLPVSTVPRTAVLYSVLL